MRQLIAEMPQR